MEYWVTHTHRVVVMCLRQWAQQLEKLDMEAVGMISFVAAAAVDRLTQSNAHHRHRHHPGTS